MSFSAYNFPLKSLRIILFLEPPTCSYQTDFLNIPSYFWPCAFSLYYHCFLQAALYSFSWFHSTFQTYINCCPMTWEHSIHSLLFGWVSIGCILHCSYILHACLFPFSCAHIPEEYMTLFCLGQIYFLYCIMFILITESNTFFVLTELILKNMVNLHSTQYN